MKRPFGEHLREWRQRRHLSQLDFAYEADVSARHLSFLETGRAQPSRSMVLLLAECLEVPLRERNVLLQAAGYTPEFAERALDDPAMASARQAIELILKGHEPFPALAVDRHWNLVLANETVGALIAGAAPKLLEPPVNVLRLSLHPEGLAPHIVNLAEWRSHLLTRLRRQVLISGDPVLAELLQELEGYPSPEEEAELDGIAVPFQLASPAGTLSFLSTTTVFGTPVDITLSELALECFYPADAFTAAALTGR